MLEICSALAALLKIGSHFTSFSKLLTTSSEIKILNLLLGICIKIPLELIQPNNYDKFDLLFLIIYIKVNIQHDRCVEFIIKQNTTKNSFYILTRQNNFCI